MSLVAIVWRNLTMKRVRTALTALAVAIGVGTGITISLITSSIRTTAVSILQIGSADFSVTQKGVTDTLNSVMDEKDLASIAGQPGVESALGVLVAVTKLDADHPIFLEIGVAPDKLAEFGVRVVDGRPYGAESPDEVMLGYRAARNLDLGVGDSIVIDGDPKRIVGVFATGQEFGDSASMLPLATLQGSERKAGDVTIAFVRARDGTDIDALRARIEHDDPQLVTVRTAEEFGRADRNLQLISAADRGATIVALTVGALVVANAMMLSYSERTREFGVLRAIGWSRRRIAVMVLGEAAVIGFVGAALGTLLSYVATRLLERTPRLVGILDPHYTAGVFGRALVIAGGMVLVGSLYPASRAALLTPIEALRRE